MKNDNSRIWLSLAHMGGSEEKYIREAFETNWVVPLGPNVDGFENDIAEYLEGGEVVALGSGTAAIHLALVMLGVSRGDEVICQSFTFAATANPIVYCDARPVFVDSEPDTWNISPKLLEKAIIDRLEKTGKTPRAIIPVHLYGMPAKMREISEIARRYDIPLIEDAAEALGSSYGGVKCGRFGDYAALSFNGNKIITTSGGGALVCPDKESADRVKFYATQARENRPYYYHEHIGYNYRMSNICAGIGRGQMEVLGQHVNRRRQIHDRYLAELSSMAGINVMNNPAKGYDSNFWLTCVLIDESKAGFTVESLRIHLENLNIESRLLWRPMHMQPVFESCPAYVDGVSEDLFSRGLCLPSGSSLTDGDTDRVIEGIKSFAKKRAL